MNKCVKYILAFFLTLTASLCAPAAVTVQAKLDSTYLLMGQMTTLHLTVTQPKNVKGGFKLFSTVPSEGIIPVCNDSVEFRMPSRIDTVAEGSNLRISYDVPVQAFDSGYYKLPEMVFVAGNDSARSKSLGLKVVPVPAKADEPIYDYASVADPANPKFLDFVPDLIWNYWWIILIVLLAIALGVYAMLRYKREGTLLPKKPEPTPYEAATAALTELKSKKLWEQGMEREYYTELTEILRKYLYGRFGINAMEMTSRQILAAISRKKQIADQRVNIRQILDMADFVKFAKIRPLPEDNVKSFDYARKFVEETKPVLEPEENAEAKPEGKAKDKPNGKAKGKPDGNAKDKSNDKTKGGVK